ncbi:MAG: DUF6491 family protein [Steroidobacteraceae bacterium]|jgi:hypothetical protein|nr:DUF6491 family protein [Steroidobacteraceae bacterium]
MERDAADARCRARPRVLALAAILAIPVARADQSPPAVAPGAVVPGHALQGEALHGRGIEGHGIDGWQALPDGTLMIRTSDGRRYRARLMGTCIGLKVAGTIAFVTRGERSVDRFAGIMLPDGTRCYFRSLEPLSRPTDGRDDPAPR